MNVEEILALMRAELSRLERIDRAGIAVMQRRSELRTALRVNEEFIRAALRAKERVS